MTRSLQNYLLVYRCIDSCRTQAHLAATSRMIANFSALYPDLLDQYLILLNRFNQIQKTFL